MKVSREQVLAHRVAASSGDGLLDLGVQDTGPDGGLWALALREVTPPDLVLAWTLRGAPHYYRRAEVASVAAATAPFSEADAAKRVFDAAKPLREAGIPVLDALARVAKEMRGVVTRPTVKGDLSTALTDRLPAAHLRYCRVCEATHSYEQPFRLAALHGGLELQPGTSPPVLQRIKGWRGPAASVPEHLDVIRAYLRLFGPATPAQVAAYVDAPVTEVRAHWPTDAEEVSVGGERRWAIAFDPHAPIDSGRVRLLGPFDVLLQGRDRELLVPDAARRKELWVVLGRPGGILRGAEIVGTWRPRAKGGRLELALDLWKRVPRALLEEQAETLASYRGVDFAGFQK